MIEYKIGETVRWCCTKDNPSTYVILDITDKDVLLRQNFSLKLVLKYRIPISEISKN